jgi:transcriptional regulator with XRE-family HTH domain
MTLKEIRELLLLKEWTREQLAELLGITRNTIDRWFCVREDHRRHPSPEHVERMRVWLASARDEVRKQPA